MKRIMTIGVAAAGALAAAVLWPASPAAAHPTCPDGHHCGFDAGFTSGRKNFFNSDDDFRNDRFSTGQIVDNNTRSASNSTSTIYSSNYYLEVGYTGFLFCVNPGGAVGPLADVGSPGDGQGLGNEASSLLLIPDGSSPVCLG